MKTKDDRLKRRPPTTARGLTREVTYLHEDEEEAVLRHAQRERCSKAEVIRRAVRAYFKIED